MTGRIVDLDAVHAEFSAHAESVYDLCDRLGISVVEARGQMRGMTQEEVLRLVPRRFHMAGPENRQVCKTPHVSQRFLTKDRDKVTCKLCLEELRGEDR